MNSPSLRVMRGRLLREVITLLLFASLMLQSATAVAPVVPGWWTTRQVFTPGATADDYAVANLGQLKNMAVNAAQELDDNLPNGAGDDIHALVDAWSLDPDEGVTRDDYAALTVGQLKAVGQLFYDRLIAEYLRPSGSYPWTGTNADDYALANVGQLKNVFAFDTSFADTNNNSIPDLWEMQMFHNLDQSKDGDFDGDGLNNLTEWQAGTDPTNQDTNGDGYSDSVEFNNGFDPVGYSSMPINIAAWLFEQTTEYYVYNVISRTDPSHQANLWRVYTSHSFPGDANTDYYFVNSKPAFPALSEIPDISTMDFSVNNNTYTDSFPYFAISRTLEYNYTGNWDFGGGDGLLLFDSKELRVQFGQISASVLYQSLKARTFYVLKKIWSRAAYSNNEFQEEAGGTEIVPVQIPAGSMQSDPVKISLEVVDGKERKIVATPVANPAFKLRNDADFLKGWDDTGAEAWTSVGVGRTNSIVKLTGAIDDLELVVDTSSTDYLSISNQTITNGSDTNFDIAGIKDSAPLANGATVILQKKSTKAKLLTLHVHVLTPTIINTNVFYAFDDRDVVKASRFTNPPTPNAIKSELDATYVDQACVTFTMNAGNPFTISQCYGGFAADGACYKNRASGSGSLTSADVVINAASQAGFNTTKTLNIVVMKDVRQDVAGGGYSASLGLTDFGTPFPFVDASAPIATFAHETGHSLLLSTKIDPATNQHHDMGKGPDGNRGLMYPSGGSRWIRQEDWRQANNYARGTVYH